MEKRFECNKHELAQARITFWVYAASIPIIIFLYLLPMIRSGRFEFSMISLVYLALIAFLGYQTYRVLRVLLSTKRTYCVVTDERVSGVSIPNPFQKPIPFVIQRSEILGVGKSTVPVGGMREYNALILNTKSQKFTLFAIEQIDDLRRELQ